MRRQRSSLCVSNYNGGPYSLHHYGEEQSLNHSHDVQAFALSHQQPQTVLGLPSFELDMYKAQRTGGYISDT
jgi:hypothetical protein